MHLPIEEQQTFANFSRYTQSGAAPWALTLKMNKVPTPNFEDGVQNQKVLDAMEKAAVTKKWVAVK